MTITFDKITKGEQITQVEKRDKVCYDDTSN